MQIAVTQVVADHQLVFAHLCQHGSHGVPKSVPAHAGDADLLEGRLDLLLQHRSQVERLASPQSFRREDEIARLVVETYYSDLHSSKACFRLGCMGNNFADAS